MSVPDLSSGLASRLEALTPAQRALFELALRKQAAASVPAVQRTIPRRACFSPCVLSFDQERLWFVQQLDTSSPIYNVYQATRYRFVMEPLTLARALNEVVRQQESLRTTFQTIDGQPMQVIAPAYEINLPWIDLRSLPAERREEEVLRASTQVVSPAFDLGRLPLVRIVLIQVEEEDYVNPVCMHHLVTDWISTYTLLTGIMETYNALRAGLPSPLTELPVQYGDFAEWQRARLSDPVLVEQMVAYWRKRLADAPELLPLPYDRPRPVMQTARGRRTLLTLSAAHSTGLRGLAQRHEATLFIVLLAALKALLVRVTGEEKLIVGTPSAHRNLPELERVVGFFLNQLALYTDLTGNPSLLEVVRRVRETAMGAYAHEEMPFAKLVETLRPQRDISRTPFTQVVLLLLAPHVAMERRNLTGGDGVENYWVDAHRTQFDFNLSFWEATDGSFLSGWWEHSTDLFDSTTIDRLKDQLRRVVAALVEDPETRLWDVPLLSAAQSHQLLLEWGGEGVAATGPAVHERFAAQAARSPAATALVAGERLLTYDELNRWANRLAHQLRRLGVGPERVVGLCLERSPELVAGILGVLKAGGAYLVLDPALPDARLSFQMSDAQPAVVLAGPGLTGRQDEIATAGKRVEPLVELAATAQP
ncbi:MAG TPA: condensation domain-containing protein, partial [Thermoanaerobaculia bacterium]|nr:condensation domain-containing protein [Thermoanaerobaculia bacterium]